MTFAQIKRIRQNNYCSEHDKQGKQTDYEAKGYKDAIDARYWELSSKAILEKNNRSRQNELSSIDNSRRMGDIDTDCDVVSILDSDILAMDRQIAILKAFNKWRYISNEIYLTIN